MWHVHTGRLLATFRGHSKEICDIDINFENTLVASASLDKKVRVWNLKTTKMECVLHGHQSGVNTTRVGFHYMSGFFSEIICFSFHRFVKLMIDG